MQGIQHLVQYLDQCVAGGVDNLNDNAAELCCEALKISFNLLLTNEIPPETSVDTYSETQLQHDLIKIVRQFLPVKSNAISKREELKR